MDTGSGQQEQLHQHRQPRILKMVSKVIPFHVQIRIKHSLSDFFLGDCLKGEMKSLQSFTTWKVLMFVPCKCINGHLLLVLSHSHLHR